jgi:hypothetical protein
MRFLRDLSAGGRAAFGALCLALLVLAAAAAGAARLDPLPVPAATPRAATLPEPASPPPSVLHAVLAAVERDPFSPDRRRPAERYRMPGELPAAVIAAPARTTIQLHGVVVLPSGGGLAALYAVGRSSQVVRVGQDFEGYRLASVAPGQVVLVGHDTTLTLRIRGH